MKVLNFCSYDVLARLLQVLGDSEFDNPAPQDCELYKYFDSI